MVNIRKIDTSQAWSMDVMIAIVIFIGAISIFYLIFVSKPENKIKTLENDASKVLENLNISENISQINELLQENYTDLKRKLRVENEFCIYFEDTDSNIINVSPGQTGIGSEKINVTDVPCKI